MLLLSISSLYLYPLDNSAQCALKTHRASHIYVARCYYPFSPRCPADRVYDTLWMWMALSVCPLGPSQKFLILHKLYSRREHFSTSVRALRWQTRTRWEVSRLKWINLHKFLLQGSHYLKKSPSPTGIKSPPGCCLEPNNETSLSPCDEIINGRPLISPSPQVLWCITKKLH